MSWQIYHHESSPVSVEPEASYEEDAVCTFCGRGTTVYLLGTNDDLYYNITNCTAYCQRYPSAAPRVGSFFFNFMHEVKIFKDSVWIRKTK
jgi:hypothetical protein